MKRHRIVQNENGKFEYLFRKYGKLIQIHTQTHTYTKKNLCKKENAMMKSSLMKRLERMRRNEREKKKLSTKYMIYDKRTIGFEL